MDKLKTGIFVMLVGISILGMTASSVSAAWTFTDITGDTVDKEGQCGGNFPGYYVVTLCQSKISEGGSVEATAKAKSNNGNYDEEIYTFNYGWPYEIGAYAKAGGSNNWHYASVYRY